MTKRWRLIFDEYGYVHAIWKAIGCTAGVAVAGIAIYVVGIMLGARSGC